MSGQLVLGALRQACQTLREAGIDSAVMGGLSLSRWQRRRLTDDVDLLIAIDPPNADDVVRILMAGGFHPRRFPPVVQIDDHRFVRFIYTPPGRYENIDVDVLFADSPFLQSALARSVELRVEEFNIDVRVISCEDLIILKLQADRLLDRIDVIALLQLNRPTLDWSYLRDWLNRLSMAKEWNEAWPQAFPDDPSPISFSSP